MHNFLWQPFFFFLYHNTSISSILGLFKNFPILQNFCTQFFFFFVTNLKLSFNLHFPKIIKISQQKLAKLLFQSFANVMLGKSYFSQMGTNLLIRQTDTHPLVDMTAKEFMFGYKSTLVTLGNKILPSWIAFDKLGLIDRVSTPLSNPKFP